jgi:AcrR family transcriptional regulator
MIPVFQRQDDDRGEGLRSRKKVRTRLAIEEAALTLFADQGYDGTTIEQIAEAAEFSPTTFFRYFASKSEVLLAPQQEQLPELQDAIRTRPAGESDLEAVRRAVQQAWVAHVDPDRTARMARALSSSHAALGIREVVGAGWSMAMAEALADRRGLAKPDEACVLAAQVGLLVFARVIAKWVARESRQDLARAVDKGFDVMIELCGSWSAGGA